MYEPMTIGYVSCSPCYGLQYMLLQEGHTLKVLIDEWESIPGYPDIEDHSGLKNMFGDKLSFVSLEDLSDCEFIFVDYNDVPGALMSELRALDVPVIGPDDVTDLLEEDRGFGKKVALMCGLKVKDGFTANTLAEAEAYLEVFAKAREGGSTAVYLKGASNSVAASSAQEAYDLLKSEGLGFFAPPSWVTEGHSTYKAGVYIDPAVEGTEVAFGIFWSSDAKTWADRVVMTREFKHAMPGGEGSILTGEIGTGFEFMPFSAMPPVFQRAFKVLASKVLVNTEYTGFIDINTIVDKAGDVWFLEWTTRPGYPTELETAGWCADTGYNYGHWLRGLATGKFDHTPPATRGVAVALYAHGLGLANYDACTTGITPKVFGVETAQSKRAVFLPFDVAWDGAGDIRIQTWDRGAFFARYDVVTSSYEVESWRTLSNSLEEAVRPVRAWGHMIRRDLFGSFWGPQNTFRELRGVTRMLEELSEVPMAGLSYASEEGLQCTTTVLSASEVPLLLLLEGQGSRYGMGDEWGYADFAEEIGKWGTDDPLTQVTALVDGASGLYVAAALWNTTWEQGVLISNLLYITTAMDQENRGFASRILNTVHGIMKAQGSELCRLQLGHDGPELKAWYEKRGYVEQQRGTEGIMCCAFKGGNDE